MPPTILRLLVDRLTQEIDITGAANQPCQGPLLSRTQFRVDIEKLGYKDARLLPEGNMSAAGPPFGPKRAKLKSRTCLNRADSSK